MCIDYIVEIEYNGFPLMRVLKGKLGLSTRLLFKLKAQNKIFNNGELYRVIDIVHTGDKVHIDLNFFEEPEFVEAENIPLKILYEDEGLIAIDKEAGMVVHPSANHLSGTIANGLLFYFKSIGLNIKIRPVSRLDKGTSGVILFAKNSYVQENLIRQMADKTFIKEYIGIVSGSFKEPNGTIDLPIDRKEGSTIVREINPLGARSITHYKTIAKNAEMSLVKFNLETGRTHQIRVHCQALEHPLIGDTLYSSIPNSDIARQALHARKIHFLNPISQEITRIKSPIPQDISAIITKFKILGPKCNTNM